LRLFDTEVEVRTNMNEKLLSQLQLDIARIHNQWYKFHERIKSIRAKILFGKVLVHEDYKKPASLHTSAKTSIVDETRKGEYGVFVENLKGKFTLNDQTKEKDLGRLLTNYTNFALLGEINNEHNRNLISITERECVYNEALRNLVRVSLEKYNDGRKRIYLIGTLMFALFFALFVYGSSLYSSHIEQQRALEERSITNNRIEHSQQIIEVCRRALVQTDVDDVSFFKDSICPVFLTWSTEAYTEYSGSDENVKATANGMKNVCENLKNDKYGEGEVYVFYQKIEEAALKWKYPDASKQQNYTFVADALAATQSPYADALFDEYSRLIETNYDKTPTVIDYARVNTHEIRTNLQVIISAPLFDELAERANSIHEDATSSDTVTKDEIIESNRRMYDIERRMGIVEGYIEYLRIQSPTSEFLTEFLESFATAFPHFQKMKYEHGLINCVYHLLEHKSTEVNLNRLIAEYNTLKSEFIKSTRFKQLDGPTGLIHKLKNTLAFHKSEYERWFDEFTSYAVKRETSAFGMKIKPWLIAALAAIFITRSGQSSFVEAASTTTKVAPGSRQATTTPTTTRTTTSTTTPTTTAVAKHNGKNTKTAPGSKTPAIDYGGNQRKHELLNPVTQTYAQEQQDYTDILNSTDMTNPLNMQIIFFNTLGSLLLRALQFHKEIRENPVSIIFILLTDLVSAIIFRGFIATPLSTVSDSIASVLPSWLYSSLSDVDKSSSSLYEDAKSYLVGGTIGLAGAGSFLLILNALQGLQQGASRSLCDNLCKIKGHTFLVILTTVVAREFNFYGQPWWTTYIFTLFSQNFALNKFILEQIFGKTLGAVGTAGTAVVGGTAGTAVVDGTAGTGSAAGAGGTAGTGGKLVILGYRINDNMPIYGPAPTEVVQTGPAPTAVVQTGPAPTAVVPTGGGFIGGLAGAIAGAIGGGATGAVNLIVPVPIPLYEEGGRLSKQDVIRITNALQGKNVLNYANGNHIKTIKAGLEGRYTPGIERLHKLHSGDL
jgi:hypothetical protein